MGVEKGGISNKLSFPMHKNYSTGRNSKMA